MVWRHIVSSADDEADTFAGVSERSGANSSVTYYKPSVGYRVVTAQGRLLLKMSFHRDALSLGLLRDGVHELTVDLVDAPPDCFAALPLDLGARSAAAMDLLVRDLADVLPSDRSPSNADQPVACRQVSSASSRSPYPPARHRLSIK